VREGLWEVPELAPRAGVVLLGEEPDVVPERHETVEQGRRVVVPSLEREHLDEPERAREEDALAGRQAVDVLVVGAVAEQEPLRRAVPARARRPWRTSSGRSRG
jgi:hypothetical protein